MRGPRLTEENLRNQVDVVKEEIRVNVLNRPYGGFPWLQAAAGDVRHVPQRARRLRLVRRPGERHRRRRRRSSSSATTPAATRCWRWPATSTWPTATALIERHFGDVPARPAPARPDFAEPDLTARAARVYTDRLAPLPAVAGGWRVPDPIGDFADYLPYVVLAEVLTDGDASRLVERLVQRDRTVTSIGGYIGFMGDDVPGARPDRAAAAGAPAARRRRRQGAAHGRRGAGPAGHRRPRARRAGPHPGPDGHPPAARHRRGARPGAADGRAGAAARPTRSCSTNCPSWSARSPRRRSSPPPPRCGRTRRATVEVVPGAEPVSMRRPCRDLRAGHASSSCPGRPSARSPAG